MKSSLVFVPGGYAPNYLTRSRLETFFKAAEELAQVLKQPVVVTMQHSLREDVFTVMAEAGAKTLAHTSRDPLSVFRHVADDMQTLLRRTISEQNQAKEPAPRKKGSRGRRRASSAGKRRS